MSSASFDLSPVRRTLLAAGADEHVYVALHVQDMNLDGVEILSLRCRADPSQNRQADGKQRPPHRREIEPSAPHSCSKRPYCCLVLAGTGSADSFNTYSGYIVAAPPRAASAGIPYFAGNSPRNVFVPGR